MEDAEKVRSRELSARIAFLDGLIKSISALLESEHRNQDTERLLHPESLEHARDIATILGSNMPLLREMLEEYQEELVLVRERESCRPVSLFLTQMAPSCMTMRPEGEAGSLPR